MKHTPPNRVRFGVFELDLKSGELRAGDQRSLLPEQPLQVVRMLIERDGDIVSREEIRKRFWPNDTIVEFDHSINAAINKLRKALGDSADQPKYVETLARRGYRLMVPVEWVKADDSPTPTLSPEAGEKGGAPEEGAAVWPQPEASYLIGEKVSHYRVLEVIGGGGMGLVYKAEDYEMATGRRAFSGDTVGAVCEAILHNSPVPVRELNAKLPARLVTTIDKSLEKERGQRYQSATEVRVDLEKVQKDAEIKGARRSHAAWAAVVLVLAALAVGLYLRRSSRATGPGVSPPSLEVRQLTESGNAVKAAVTPDGRYVAYVKREGGNYELRLLQVATERDVQLVPGLPLAIKSLHFSPDGNYLYFLRVLDPAKDFNTCGVFRIAVLGGPVTPLVTDAHTGDARMGSVTVSPDGKQVAYIAQTPTESLIVAVDPDGANRRVLAKRPAEHAFALVEWSPSQGTLAAIADIKGYMGLVRVELPSGSITDLSVSGWGALGQPAWSPDGATIFAPAVPDGSSINQIWAFDARSGAHRPLTSSSTAYQVLSLSATASGDLVANSLTFDTSLWAVDSSGGPQPVPALRGEGWESVAWVDGRIVTSNSDEMVVHDPDGSNPTKLRSYSLYYTELAACGPRHVAYSALDPNRHSHIASTDITTGSTSPLTEGPFDYGPACATGASTLAFVQCIDQGNRCFLTRKSFDSGQSFALYELGSVSLTPPAPSLSLDGRNLLFFTPVGAGDPYKWAAIIPTNGGDPKKLKMPVPASDVSQFKWAADGKSILYARRENGVGNIWSVPIDGKAPRKITNFDSERIFAFDVSPDNRLVISRGHMVSDVVLIKNVR